RRAREQEVIKPIAFVPDAVIEEMTLKLLADFESRFGKITHPPVPINKIIERQLDLRIDWDEILDSEEEKILGCLDPSQKKMYMNIRHRNHFETYIGTEAYTQAHEVGHWEMHIIKTGETQLELLPFGGPPKY